MGSLLCHALPGFPAFFCSSWGSTNVVVTEGRLNCFVPNKMEVFVSRKRRFFETFFAVSGATVTALRQKSRLVAHSFHTLLAFSDTAAGTQESVDCQIFFIYLMEIHCIYRGYAHDSGGWGHQRWIGKNNGGNQPCHYAGLARL